MRQSENIFWQYVFGTSCNIWYKLKHLEQIGYNHAQWILTYDTPNESASQDEFSKITLYGGKRLFKVVINGPTCLIEQLNWPLNVLS